ncbi:MAG: class I SAM-dependent methyltransferase [Steroidobacteraceae bacterium]
MRTHTQTVVAQFDPKSQAYLTSAVHAAGPDLKLASQLVQQPGLPRGALLDVGCGAGHLAFALAPHFERAVAVDPAPAMLATVAAAAAQRGLPQIQVQQAIAENLPFAAGSFHVVGSRYSAHHWRDVPAALREMRRVATPGAMLLMIDLMGDERPLVDTHLQAIELLRDPSHVRDYSPSQWRCMLRDAGFDVQREAFWPTRLQFSSWVERMQTAPVSVAVIRTLLADAAQEVRTGLGVEPDGSFIPHTGLFWARAAAT